MSGHTPGPWLADTDRARLRAVVRKGMTPIAEMWMTGQPVDEREANARIVAAAPELLTRLETAIHRLEDMLNGDDGQAWKEAEKFLPLARAAIAKATQP